MAVTAKFIVSMSGAQERFRDFAESASDWFWELDRDLRFTFISDRFEKLVGHPISDLIGVRRWDMSLADQNLDIWGSFDDQSISSLSIE